MKNLKDWLTNLQNSDDAVKKRWLIILSGLSMIVIIFIWIMYLNNSIKKADEQPRQSETTIWQIFKNGLQIAGNSAKEKSVDLIYKITGKRIIEIE